MRWTLCSVLAVDSSSISDAGALWPWFFRECAINERMQQCGGRDAPLGHFWQGGAALDSLQRFCGGCVGHFCGGPLAVNRFCALYMKMRWTFYVLQEAMLGIPVAGAFAFGVQ